MKRLLILGLALVCGAAWGAGPPELTITTTGDLTATGSASVAFLVEATAGDSIEPSITEGLYVWYDIDEASAGESIAASTFIAWVTIGEAPDPIIYSATLSITVDYDIGVHYFLANAAVSNIYASDYVRVVVYDPVSAVERGIWNRMAEPSWMFKPGPAFQKRTTFRPAGVLDITD